MDMIFAGPYSAFLVPGPYLCKLNFDGLTKRSRSCKPSSAQEITGASVDVNSIFCDCINFYGWTLDILSNVLHGRFGNLLRHNSVWEQNGGPYQARKLVFQGRCTLRGGLTRLGKPFRSWSRSGPGTGFVAETKNAVKHDAPAAGGNDGILGQGTLPADYRSMAVHDMRTSLVLIGGFIQRLATDSQQVDVERQRRYLGIIKKEGRKLEALLDDFLACTDPVGEPRLELRPIRLDRELHDLCKAHQLRAARGKVTLRVKKPPRLFPIPADRNRLQRVFGNLLDNALKFSPPESTVLVRIRTRGGEVHISFADEGPGIDSTEMPYLFDTYYRGRTGRQTGGSGLGLATVKAVVEAHGGRVQVKNRVEKGAVFTVIIPFRPK